MGTLQIDMRHSLLFQIKEMKVWFLAFILVAHMVAGQDTFDEFHKVKRYEILPTTISKSKLGNICTVEITCRFLNLYFRYSISGRI